jgi:hypothetical protein
LRWIEGGRNLDKPGPGGDDPLGEGADPEESLEPPAADVFQPGGAIQHDPGERRRRPRLTQVGSPDPAVATGPARGDETEGHPFSGAEIGHTVADRLDHPCPLMAQDGRKSVMAKMPEGKVEVGMANSRRFQPHQDLSR